MGSRLYPASIGALIFAVAAILTGAIVTSTRVPFQMPGLLGVNVHRVAAIVAIGLTVAVAVLISQASISDAMRSVGFAGAALLCSAASGWNFPLSPFEAAWHAAFSHLAIIGVASTCVLVSKSWNEEAAPLNSRAFRALRPSAIALPFVVYLQVTLGAIYRHNMSGVLPHISVAMIVAILALVVATTALQHFGACVPLRRAALWLITIVLIQICLGIGAFVMKLLDFTANPYFVWTATAHATIGALVLASSVVMALEARRYLVR